MDSLSLSEWQQMDWHLLRLGNPIAATIVVLQSVCGPAPAAGNGPPPLIDQEVRSAIASGSARVIVELRITPGFRPEGELSDASAAAAQRNAIATAQAQILSRLRGSHFRLIHQYDSLPLLALEIGPDALALLETFSDVVVRVLEDAKRTPTSPRRPSP